MSFVLFGGIAKYFCNILSLYKHISNSFPGTIHISS